MSDLIDGGWIILAPYISSLFDGNYETIAKAKEKINNVLG
jgi:hypothetical protein